MWASWFRSYLPSFPKKSRGYPKRPPYGWYIDDCPDPDPLDFVRRLPLTRPSSPNIAVTNESSESSQFSDSSEFNDISLSRTSPSRVQTSLEGLPREIQQMIFVKVLGGRTIHLEVQKSHVVSFECMATDTKRCSSVYRPQCRNPKQLFSFLPPRQPVVRGKLALIMVSKHFYNETIHLLYSSNAFVVIMPQVLEWMPSIILPQRIHVIRFLRFTWHQDMDPPLLRPSIDSDKVREIFQRRHDRWNKVWHNISKMEGLYDFQAHLIAVPHWSKLNEQSAQILMAPIKQITKPEIFILVLTFPTKGESTGNTPNWYWTSVHGWEGPDPWDELPNCTIQRLDGTDTSPPWNLIAWNKWIR